MYENATKMQSEFYAPLTNVWMARIRAAQTSRERFDKIGKTCNDFYESQAGFMWNSPEYFSGTIPKPRFQICIAKAFEYVAIYGPHLFWQYADRKVMSQRQLQLTPQLFGNPNDPQVAEFANQYIMQDQLKQYRQEFINEMMSIYLNWSQREQPAGGMIHHGMMAIIESLIKGMGLLWPETYSQPGSEATYTKLTYDTVDNLYIDPDCKDPLWESAGYIIRRHKNPIWEVERIFGLERGALENHGTHSSEELTARKSANQATKDAKTFDCLEWYEIWSRVGVGPRTAQVNHHMIDMFDQELGDFAYLCIAPGVPWPLNSPPDRYYGENAAKPDDIREMFQWRCANYGDPFPCYKDGRWPVNPVSYNPVPKSAWPLAPLAPGLGELIAINVLTSSYVDSAWSNRRQILAYVKSAASELQQVLDKDEALAVVGLNDNIHSNINEVLQFLNRPSTPGDQLQALGMLSENFNRRVGLNELQYGESRTQIRVAADSRAKTEALSIRPQKMSLDVGRWLSEASQSEMFLAALHVKGQDLVHLLGEFGAEQWDMAYSQMPIEVLMRECKATVEASEVQRPNKERDTANIQALQQYLMPLLQQYAQQTTNTEPLNQFIEMVADAMDMHGPPVQLPPWQPPVDEAQQQAQQIQQQLHQAEQQAEIRRKTADASAKEATAQKHMTDTAITVMESQVPTRLLGEMKHEQELRQTEELHQQSLLHNEQDQVQELIFGSLQNRQTIQAGKVNDGGDTD